MYWFAPARSKRRGKDIIHLEIGEPDFPTPQNIIDAGKKALDEGWTHYGPSQGLPELREAIAEYISANARNYGQSGECVRGAGRQADHLFPHDGAARRGRRGRSIRIPDFPIYESMIRVCGAKAVPVPLVEERGFSFDLDVFRKSLTDRTKMVVLNSPQNPTGGMIPPEDIAAIADAGARSAIWSCFPTRFTSRIVYGDERPVSIATMPGMLEKTIILDGFSKTYAMTGWRMGYGVMPPFLVDAVNKLMVNSNSCTASFTQRAGIAALRGPQEPVTAMVEEFRRRRDAFCAGLNDIPGWRCAIPGGAFYAFANVKGGGTRFEGGRRFAAERCGRGLPERRGIRRVRRRLHPVQLRQFVRESDARHRADPGLGRRTDIN